MNFIFKIFQKKILLKIMTSFFIVLIIPVISLYFLIHNSLNNLLVDEAKSRSIEMLELAKDSIDLHLTNMKALTFQIASNPIFSPLRMQQNFTNVYDSITFIKNIPSPGTIYTSFTIYYSGQSLLYSQRGTFRTDDYMTKIYNFTNWSIDALDAEIREIKTPYFKVARQANSPDVITHYVIPLEYSSGEVYGAILFVIDENSLCRSIDPIAAQGGSVLILDSQKEIVSSKGEITEKMLTNTKDYSDFAVNTLQEFDDESISLAVISNKTGITYAISIPRFAITGPFDTIQVKIIIYTILILISGLCIAAVFIYVNYNPIKNLVNRITTGSPNVSGNELDIISTAINSMSNTISDLKLMVDDSIPLVRKDLFYKLIKGNYSDIEAFNSEAQKLGASLNGSYFVIAAINCKINAFAQSGALPEAWFEKTFAFEDMDVFCFEAPSRQYYLLIISVTNIPSDGIIRYFKNINWDGSEYIKKEDIRIGFSNYYSDLSTLNNAFVEAMTTLEFASTNANTENFISFNEICQYNHNINMLYTDRLELLENSLTKGDYDSTIKIVHEMLDTIMTENMPIFIIKSLLYSIIGIIHKIAQQLNLNYLIDMDIMGQIFTTDYDTVNRMAEAIDKVCTELILHINEGHAVYPSQLMKKAVEYVNQNYADCNFSLQNVAGEIGLSVSNLSHTFKLTFNENISDYVNRLRMEKAKAILIDKDISLQEVALTIGYFNTSSFIRKFKQYTGVTPGVFRKVIK